MPQPCVAQCVASGQTWRELGECLGKRVDVVVCKARDGEGGAASGSVSSTASASASVNGSGAEASSSTGAASVTGVTHVGGSKAAAVLFGTLAVVSFAGMLL